MRKHLIDSLSLEIMRQIWIFGRQGANLLKIVEICKECCLPTRVVRGN